MSAQESIVNIGLTILTIIITAVITILVTEFLPSDLKYKLRYRKKQFTKWIKSPSVKIKLVFKSEDVADKELSIESTLEKIRQELIKHDHNISAKQDSVQFDLQVGKSNIKSEISLLSVQRNGSLVVSQIQCSLGSDCGYRRLDSDMLELTQAQRRIENYIRNVVPDFLGTVSLVCELNSLYELTGILSEFNIGALSANLQNKIDFDMSDNKLVVYGKDIDSYITSFLHKMITLYF